MASGLPEIELNGFLCNIILRFCWYLFYLTSLISFVISNIFCYFSVLFQDMKLRIQIVFILIGFLALNLAQAQQEPQFSQNMFNTLTINPGYAGSNDAICATALYRNQWTGFIGAPKTGLLNVEAPVKVLKGGLGLTIINDKLGLDKTMFVKLAYAYHLNIGAGKLGIGLQAGFTNKTLEASKFNAFVSDGSDQTIPTQDISAGSPTFGFGLFYKTDLYYMGLSTTQLAESSVGYTSDLDYKLKRHYYLKGGLSRRLSSTLEIQPSLFFKFNPPVAPQIDLNALILYNNQFWGGVSYRVMDVDALVAMVGLMWNNIKFGYSYDMTLNELRGFSSGSHEIMIGHCFKLNEKIEAQRYRNVRFL